MGKEEVKKETPAPVAPVAKVSAPEAVDEIEKKAMLPPQPVAPPVCEEGKPDVAVHEAEVKKETKDEKCEEVVNERGMYVCMFAPP